MSKAINSYKDSKIYLLTDLSYEKYFIVIESAFDQIMGR